MWIHPIRQLVGYACNAACNNQAQRRLFHDYFVSYLPSSSLHPDSKYSGIDLHKFPEKKSKAQDRNRKNETPPISSNLQGSPSRETTVVRIPIRSAKHHFGVSMSRGSRPYNEDAYQAGTIEIPAFANRRPISWNRATEKWGKKEARIARDASEDPQVFYYGIFDGHGGSECSDWLREKLHTYIESSVALFGIKSTLMSLLDDQSVQHKREIDFDASSTKNWKNLSEISMHQPANLTAEQELSLATQATHNEVLRHEQKLVKQWSNLVGGYFRRFRPAFFSSSTIAQQSKTEKPESLKTQEASANDKKPSVEAALMYAFLKADFDFISAQSSKDGQEDTVISDRALNENDILDSPYRPVDRIGGLRKFNGGSTCSIALLSTPASRPYWDPVTPCTLVTAHVGDTRIVLCNTANGLAETVTTDHHPSYPIESQRLRRYAGNFVTDSFGEERISGLANSRSFGDMTHKRIGISAEPELRRLEIGPAEYSFLVLVSDGVSGVIGDQEIVDIVKEAKTPEQGARDVVSFATEVSVDADNATALVVRLGGWERRSEGGLGSLGSKELRDWRKTEAQNPRRRT